MKKILFGLLSVICMMLSAQETGKGTLTGEIRDAGTKSPLPGASIVVMPGTKGGVADENGNFQITGIQAGSYSVKVSYMGYKQKVLTDVIVRPARETPLTILLEDAQVNLQEVVVKGGYFTGKTNDVSSVTALSYEEIRRSPGSYGDISRVLYGLPSAAKVTDEKNTLMIRGGSPSENSFYIDNIEIPNINHFPVQGTAGGAISFLNVDFISDISFTAGGFGADFGGRMSSVMDISYRDGSKKGTPVQLNLDFSGFGGVAEGSFADGKGTWLASARRSYLDFLVKSFSTGSTVAPEYGDAQAKVTYELDKENKLSILALTAYDLNDNDNTAALENDMVFYGRQVLRQNAFGITHRKLWGSAGFSLTSVSFNNLFYDEDFYEAGTQRLMVNNNSDEQEFVFRNKNHLRLAKTFSIELTTEAKQLSNKYNNEYAGTVTAFGDAQGSLTLNKDRKYLHGGFGLQGSYKPASTITITAGGRYDYFEEHSAGILQPRASIMVDLDPVTAVQLTGGSYAQALPKILLAQSPQFNSLPIPYAIHYIVGVHRLLTEDTRLTVEGYLKNYRNLPVDPQQPDIMLLDESAFRNQPAFIHQNLQGGQSARSYGVELTVQKKLADEYYGMICASYGKAEYKGSTGLWLDRSIDNRYSFSIEGGYKPAESWELSLRWIYAGGRPYTPFNLVESARRNEEIYDETRINASRLADYHSLNIRVDKRWNFSASSITAYISIWNAYNRKNVAGQFWSKAIQAPKTLYQFGMLPVFGVEYEL